MTNLGAQPRRSIGAWPSASTLPVAKPKWNGPLSSDRIKINREITPMAPNPMTHATPSFPASPMRIAPAPRLQTSLVFPVRSLSAPRQRPASQVTPQVFQPSPSLLHIPVQRMSSQPVGSQRRISDPAALQRTPSHVLFTKQVTSTPSGHKTPSHPAIESNWTETSSVARSLWTEQDPGSSRETKTAANTSSCETRASRETKADKWLDVRIGEVQMCADLGLCPADYVSSVAMSCDGQQQKEFAEVSSARFEIRNVTTSRLRISLRKRDRTQKNAEYSALVCLSDLGQDLERTNVWVALVADIPTNCSDEQLSTFCLTKGRLDDSAAPARLLLCLSLSGSAPDAEAQQVLARQVGNLQNELKILQQVMSFKDRRLEEFEQRPDEEVKRLQGKLEEMNATIEYQRNSIAQLDTRCRHASQLSGSQTLASSAVNEEVALLQSQLTRMTATVDLQKTTIARLDDKCRSQVLRLTEMSSQHEKDRVHSDQAATVDSLKMHLDSKSHELEKTMAQLESWICQTEENEAKLQEDHRLSTSELQWRLHKESEAIHAAVDAENQAESRASAASSALLEAQRELQEAHDCVHALQADVLARDSTIQELRDQLEERKSEKLGPSYGGMNGLTLVQRELQGKADKSANAKAEPKPDTLQNGRTPQKSGQSQDSFHMKFEHSPMSSLATSGRSIASSAYIAQSNDEIDVLFSEIAQRKGPQLMAVCGPAGIQRTGKGKYVLGEHKVFLRAFEGSKGKELMVRRGGTFRPLDKWIDDYAMSVDFFDDPANERQEFQPPNPYADM